jgi:hypothetical protein
MRLAVLPGLALALAACARTPVDGTPQAQTTDLSMPRVELTDNFAATTWKVDPFEIVSAEVADDVLAVSVRYGGGCREHRFQLVASSTFAESEPVQTPVVLTHDARGDNCRALLSETLRYDLTPLKEAYRRAYHRQSGTIVMHLQPQAPPLRYTF